MISFGYVVLTLLFASVLAFVLRNKESMAPKLKDALLNRSKLGEILHLHDTKPIKHDTSLRIRIPRMRFDPLDKIVQFQLIIKYDGVTWDTWRRYSQFRKFYQRHDFQTDTKFPPKSTAYQIFSGSDNTLEFIDARRKQLERYMNSVIKDENIFGQVCLFLKNDDEKVGPSGRFFAVPNQVSFTNIKINPSRAEVFRTGLDAFEVFVEQLSLVDTEPVKQPWSSFFDDTKNKVTCYEWQENDKLHISVKAKVPCSNEELFNLMLDDEYRSQWDDNHEMQEIIESFRLTESQIDASVIDQSFQFLNDEDAKLSEADKEAIKAMSEEFEKKSNFKIGFVVVQYSRMKSPAPMVVAKRDFLTVCLIGKNVETNAYVFCMTSIDYGLPPKLAQEVQKASYVRAKHICSGTVLKPRGEHSELVSVSMLDPGAYVPPRIIKMFAPQKAKELPNLAALAKKRKQAKKHGASLFVQ